MFHMMAALAEFERALISERTRAGIEEARAQGRRIGRPVRLNESAISAALWAVAVEGMTMLDVAERFGVSSRTLRRHLGRARQAGAVLVPTDVAIAKISSHPRRHRQPRNLAGINTETRDDTEIGS